MRVVRCPAASTIAVARYRARLLGRPCHLWAITAQGTTWKISPDPPTDCPYWSAHPDGRLETPFLYPEDKDEIQKPDSTAMTSLTSLKPPQANDEPHNPNQS